MKKMNKSHDGVLKAKIALEAIKEEKTIGQIASEFKVHPNQIGRWKKHLLKGIPALFSDKRKKDEKDSEELETELYRQIGQLKVELDWLKKKYATLQ